MYMSDKQSQVIDRQEEVQAGRSCQQGVWDASWEHQARRLGQLWARKIGLPLAEREDFAQDVVVHAWQQCQAGKLQRKEGIWMLARNRALDARRKRKLALVPLDQCEDLGEECLRTPPQEELIAELHIQFPEEMELAQARSEGYTWEEIARVTGVSSGALRLRWHRFVQHIKGAGQVA